jgi:hypothetical protein
VKAFMLMPLGGVSAGSNHRFMTAPLTMLSFIQGGGENFDDSMLSLMENDDEAI